MQCIIIQMSCIAHWDSELALMWEWCAKGEICLVVFRPVGDVVADCDIDVPVFLLSFVCSFSCYICVGLGFLCLCASVCVYLILGCHPCLTGWAGSGLHGMLGC